MVGILRRLAQAIAGEEGGKAGGVLAKGCVGPKRRYNVDMIGINLFGDLNCPCCSTTKLLMFC